MTVKNIQAWAERFEKMATDTYVSDPSEMNAKEIMDELRTSPTSDRARKLRAELEIRDENKRRSLPKEEKAPYGWTVCRKGGTDKIIVYKRDTPADAEHWAADLAPFTFPTKRLAEESGKAGHYAYKKKYEHTPDSFTYCQNYQAHDRDCDCAVSDVALINGKEVPYKMV